MRCEQLTGGRQLDVLSRLNRVVDCCEVPLLRRVHKQGVCDRARPLVWFLNEVFNAALSPEVLQECVVTPRDSRLVHRDLFVKKDFDPITALKWRLPDDNLTGGRVEVSLFDPAGSAND